MRKILRLPQVVEATGESRSILKDYRAFQAKYSWPSTPTVASVGCYLHDKFGEVDSEELAEHAAAISYLCDVTADPRIQAILRKSRGEPAKEDNVVEFPNGRSTNGDQRSE